MNVLKAQKRNDLMVLVRAGISYRGIESKLNIRRETVSKYAKLAGPEPNEIPKAATDVEVATGDAGKTGQGWPPGRAESEAGRICIPKHAKSACEAYREWIIEQIELGRNAMSIYQDLVDKYGFKNRYNSVKRFVRGLRKTNPEQYDRLEFLPGEEAQVDYGTGAPVLNPEKIGKYKTTRLFVMTLRYSRKSFRKVVWNSSQETWAKLHEEAFRYFGGVPQYVVLDNLKEGVIKPDIFEPTLNPLYAAMLKHYGVVADPARVRDPNRKGTVESAIGHTQSTALKGKRFNTIEEQNDYLMSWEENWASKRIHGRAKRQVAVMFEEEKPSLKALPLNSFQYFKQEIRTVWDDGCIQVGNCYYAARPATIYSKVLIRIYEHEIEIFDSATMSLLRRHFKCRRQGDVIMEDDDRIFNPSRETKKLLSKAADIGVNSKLLCEKWFKEDGRQGQRRMWGLLSLSKKYGNQEIESAVSFALANNIYSSRSIKNILEDRRKKNLPQQLLLLQEHELIRTPSEYAAFFESNACTGLPKENLH